MSKETKQHPHAALIAQFARDAIKTDRPQDWWEYLNYDKQWVGLGLGLNGMPFFTAAATYRRIPQWTIDELAVGSLIELQDGTLAEIKELQSTLNIEIYEIKTDYGWAKSCTCKKYEPQKTITINGFKVPEPLREINSNTEFYYPTFNGRVVVANFIIMAELHRYLLEMGFCHATSEAAEIHSQALHSVRKGGA